MKSARHSAVLVVALSLVMPPFAIGATSRMPRVGSSKMLFAQPNASAPPQLLTGLNAELIQQYDEAFLAVVAGDSIEEAKTRGREEGIDAVVRDDYDTIALPGGVIDTRLGTAASFPGQSLSPPPAPGEPGLWLIQFVGPLLQSWQEAVRQLGVTLVQYVPYNAFIAAATDDQIRRVELLPFIQFTDVYHRFLKSDSVPRVTGQRLGVLVVLAEAPGVDGALQEIAARSDLAVEHWRAGNYIEAAARLEAADVDVVVAHPMVVAISLASFLQSSDERISMSLTRNIDATTGFPTKPTRYKQWLAEMCEYCGQLFTDGFYAGIADTGLDGGIGGTHHADLPATRIRYGTNFWTTPSGDEDPSTPGVIDTQTLKDRKGHGTMVAGTIAGDPPPGAGTDAGGFLWGTGVAPSGGIFVTKIPDDCGFNQAPPCPSSGISNPNPDRDIFVYAPDARNSTIPVGSFTTAVFLQNHSRNQYRPYTQIQGTCVTPMDGKYSTVAANFDAAVRDADGDATVNGVRPITLTVSAGNRSQQPNDNPGCPANVGLTLPPGTARTSSPSAALRMFATRLRNGTAWALRRTRSPTSWQTASEERRSQDGSSLISWRRVQT